MVAHRSGDADGRRCAAGPRSGPGLYGWSVASDDQYTYLYGHCYRQFGFGFLGHDACTAQVSVARLPLGDLGADLQYWDGSGWAPSPPPPPTSRREVA